MDCQSIERHKSTLVSASLQDVQNRWYNLVFLTLYYGSFREEQATKSEQHAKFRRASGTTIFAHETGRGGGGGGGGGGVVCAPGWAGGHSVFHVLFKTKPA